MTLLIRSFQFGVWKLEDAIAAAFDREELIWYTLL